MPRPAKGPRLELNDFGLYEVHWSETYTDPRTQKRKSRSKRVSTRTGNLQEAQRFLAGWLTEADRVQSGAWTVQEAWEFYEAEYLDAKNTAAPDNEKFRIKPILAFFADYIVSEIDATDVNEYTRRRRSGKIKVVTVSKDGTEKEFARAVSDSTIRRELGVLIAAINFCADQKKISRNDVPSIPLPAEGDARDFWLVEEELDLIMAAAQPTSAKRLTRAYRFIALARYTAARRRAIEQIDWFRTSLDRRQIDYRKPGERRTKKRKVAVPIADELLPILKRAFDEKISEHVLDNPGSIRKALDTAIERAAKMAEGMGRPEMAARIRRTTAHTFRHTWATLSAQRGVPLWKIAGVLGDTLATVERNYAHHCPDHLRDAVNARDDDTRGAQL
jgi:integrase